jgi:hypothetical protein
MVLMSIAAHCEFSTAEGSPLEMSGPKSLDPGKVDDGYGCAKGRRVTGK